MHELSHIAPTSSKLGDRAELMSEMEGRQAYGEDSLQEKPFRPGNGKVGTSNKSKVNLGLIPANII